MTIPGFTPIPITPRDHIHLGLVPSGGGMPSGFGAYGEPPYTFYHIERRTPIYEVMASFNRSIDGTPEPVSLKNISTYTTVFMGFRYLVRVDEEDLQILQRLYKNQCYLVDSRHCPEGESHTIYVKTMYFDELVYDEHLDQMLHLNNMVLTFRDTNTITVP